MLDHHFDCIMYYVLSNHIQSLFVVGYILFLGVCVFLWFGLFGREELQLLVDFENRKCIQCSIMGLIL